MNDNLIDDLSERVTYLNNILNDKYLDDEIFKSIENELNEIKELITKYKNNKE